jgi:4-hydroxy-3-polyprenylbenzoate decarboxylase
VVRAYRDRMKEHRPIPPKTVARARCSRTSIATSKVDVLKFPVPFLHEHDGGRYIGTDDLVIMRDPEENWVNCATYRVMVQDKNHVSIWISPGKHGRQIREKYFRAGKPCPVLISCGHDPCCSSPAATSSSSACRNTTMPAATAASPTRSCRASFTGLPMPAHAEIVLEGEMVENVNRQGRAVRRVHRLLRLEPERAAGGRGQARLLPQRSDPRHRLADAPAVRLLLQQMRDEGRHDLGRGRARGPLGVAGVWVHEFGGARMFNVIAIKQAYPGHARQAGLLAAGCQSASYLGRFVAVVDEDVDPDRPVRRDVGDLHALRPR